MPLDLDAARRHLMRVDPVLKPVIRRAGPCGLGGRRRVSLLEALAESIVSQQLSKKAADTIYSRFLDLFPGGRFPEAEALLSAAPEMLRACGLSRPKIAYLQSLATLARQGELRMDRLRRLSDEAVIEQLTKVKGIGRWTAEMILIFHLGRPDVLPVDDVGLLAAIERLYGLEGRPTPAQVVELGEKWRPYRSVACWYLWASRDTE
jgi:DNA-3-methyladenine glycosylase II